MRLGRGQAVVMWTHRGLGLQKSVWLPPFQFTIGFTLLREPDAAADLTGDGAQVVMLSRSPLTSCHAVQFLTGLRPVPVCGLGVEDPCSRLVLLMLKKRGFARNQMGQKGKGRATECPYRGEHAWSLREHAEKPGDCVYRSCCLRPPSECPHSAPQDHRSDLLTGRMFR
nr:uncharacterized protein LOC130541091 [Pan paniscus]